MLQPPSPPRALNWVTDRARLVRVGLCAKGEPRAGAGFPADVFLCLMRAGAGLQHEQVLPGHACGARMDEQTHAV